MIFLMQFQVAKSDSTVRGESVEYKYEIGSSEQGVAQFLTFLYMCAGFQAFRTDKVAHGIGHAGFYRHLIISDDVGFVINLPYSLGNAIGR